MLETTLASLEIAHTVERAAGVNVCVSMCYRLYPTEKGDI